MQMSPRALGSLMVVMAAGFVLSVQACDEPDKDIDSSRRIPFGESWPGPEKKLYSQFNEELIIRDFFQDRKNGVFLDVGCSKPIENSTTYYLDKHLGWSGIGIGASPECERLAEGEMARAA